MNDPAHMKTVLTIAGSDCSGGAGIQADIKTITAHRLYAMSAITALTAQNTTGVYGVQEAAPDFLANQLNCVFTDIFPDAVKIGMVGSAALIEVIAERLEAHKAKNIVADPVMIATSGSPLLREDAVEVLLGRLLPLACLITPNLPEAAVLAARVSGHPATPITDAAGMLEAAHTISQALPGAVLIKGGHLDDTADDLLFENGHAHWLRGERVENPNTHGTGCTLSSAIACGLAEGLAVEQSVRRAKAYVTGALRAGLNLGSGSGPLNHCFAL